MDSLQLKEYIPVLMLLGVAVCAAAGMLVMSVVLGRWANRGRLQRRSLNKNINTPYECGMIAVGEGNTRLSVKFYLVAMLFILFDIEVVFMYPWAVVYRDMLATHGGLILGSMVSFLGILFIGYIYALKKKAFDWKN